MGVRAKDTSVKAKPVKLEEGAFLPCAVDEATHVKLRMPGPSNVLFLPVMLSGRREGTGCWSWNGSMDAPTLRPSVLTTSSYAGVPYTCHSWINDGAAVFLDDCTHELRGQTVPLLPVDEETDA